MLLNFGIVPSKGAVLVLATCITLSLGRCGSSGGDASHDGNPNISMGKAGIDLANASRQYMMKCSVCHGADGAPVLASAPDLRTSTLSVEERVAIIAYGKGIMPPHRGVLDMPTIRGIAMYIEKFQN